MIRFAAAGLVALLTPALASAQPLGVFTWQLQSFCNLVSLTVTQNGDVFTLDGFDDQCNLGTRAPVTGLATFNRNGTVEFGLTIVATPSAAPVHVAAVISVSTLSGTWRDSAGSAGNFVFTPGGGTGGIPRPLPAGLIPTAFTFRTDGGFLGTGSLGGAGTIPASGSGTRMMWFPRKAAFRVGAVDGAQWDDANIGNESVAFNKNTRATATFSAALGDSTVASGTASTAIGYFSTASGNVATAMGSQTTASGGASTAIGSRTTASGDASTAMGSSTTASGLQSTALGFGTIASGAQATATGLGSLAAGTASFATGDGVESSGLTTFAAGFNVRAIGNRSVAMGQFANALTTGSFIFGDGSTTTVMFAPAPNTFTVRSAGGARFFSNADMNAGVFLEGGASAWATVSDEHMKENFQDLNGAEVLTKLARMPIREWNYKSQTPEIRHVGPTAQDFRAAFGLGEHPLRISTVDADGIALRAIQALVHELEALRARVAQLERSSAALPAR
jgi:hypothetical protein